jgi:hypothetical protein
MYIMHVDITASRTLSPTLLGVKNQRVFHKIWFLRQRKTDFGVLNLRPVGDGDDVSPVLSEGAAEDCEPVTFQRVLQRTTCTDTPHSAFLEIQVDKCYIFSFMYVICITCICRYLFLYNTYVLHMYLVVQTKKLFLFMYPFSLNHCLKFKTSTNMYTLIRLCLKSFI